MIRAGVEPTTYGLEGRCSIQLSYRTVFRRKSNELNEKHKQPRKKLTPLPSQKVMNTLLTTAYWAPVSYYRAWLQADSVYMEAHENYLRQTYRNRCVIGSANGPQHLSVPIVHRSGEKIPIRDVRIDSSVAWQRIHYKTVVSAYRRSPFFEYYIDDLLDLFRKRFDFLFDLNLEIDRRVFGLLRLPFQYNLTAGFRETGEAPCLNLSDGFNPRHRDLSLSNMPYEQVFGNKFGFMPDLSIMDLIFHTGPDAVSFLMKKN